MKKGFIIFEVYLAIMSFVLAWMLGTWWISLASIPCIYWAWDIYQD